MDSKKRIDVGVSAALIELKAELHRKQSELQSSRSSKQGVTKSLKVKNEPPFVKLNSGTNRGVEKRVEMDAEAKKLEEKTYEKAKQVLEAKAKLYDEMHLKALLYDETEHPVLVNSLVNFQQKAMDRINEDRLKEPAEGEPSYTIDEEEWTEFTDHLGRTRRCLKTDLPNFLARDAEMNPTTYVSKDEQIRLDKHEKWEQEAAELVDKPDVHYQDMLFDEIRAHGVGYYGFAKDDQTRANQLHELKKLTQQTDATREKVMKERSQKKLELKERLKKVRQKKRAKLGLAPAEEKAESSDEEDLTSPAGDEIIKSNEEEIKALEEPVMRAWDFGKPGVYGLKPVNFDELDAKWLKDRRTDRNASFAPPSLYHAESFKSKPSASTSSSASKYQNFVKSSAPFHPPPQTSKTYEPLPKYNSQQPMRPIHDELPAPTPEGSESWKRGAGAEVAPPPTFDYYHGDSRPTPPKRGRADDEAISEAIAQGVRTLREEFEQKLKAKANSSAQGTEFTGFM